MRILRLSTSNETGNVVDEGSRSQDVCAQLLEAVYGERVEMVVRPSWPTEDFPDVVDGFVDRYEPDAVLITANLFAFNYESVPLRLKRKLRIVGRPMAAMGFAAGNSPRIGRSRFGRWMRTRMHGWIGGDSYFEPEQVVAAMSGAAMKAAQREGTAVVIYGPISPTVGDGSIERAKGEARRLEVDRGLRALCQQKHIYYLGVTDGLEGAERPAGFKERYRHRDGLHGNNLAHAFTGLGTAQMLTVAMEDVNPRGHTVGEVREALERERARPESPLYEVVSDADMLALPFVSSLVRLYSPTQGAIQLG